MNSKHTPGPWQLKQKDRTTICDSDGVMRGCANIASTHGTWRERIANAKLISTSPELFNLLRDARDAMSDERMNDVHGILCGDICADVLWRAGARA